MEHFWSESARRLEPYVPGEQPKLAGLVKLNTNENPYPPSPSVLEAIRRAANEDLRLYPDPDATLLKQAVAKAHGLAPGNIFVGNGSDEVLAHAFLALLKHPRPLLFPDISYSFYPVYCRLYEIEHVAVPLGADFVIRSDDYARPNGGIVIPNPNAPTGRALAREDIAQLLRSNAQSVVVIDEAYVDFGAESAVPLIGEFRNLLVVQTLSKSRSLAGLRVGFALGHPALIRGLEQVKGSFNSYPLDRLALAGAVAALEDDAHFEATRRRVIATRGGLARELAALGFEVTPSSANFLFVRHPAYEGGELHRRLRERNILVRHFARPRIDQYLRITVGTDEQCHTLVRTLEEIVSGSV